MTGGTFSLPSMTCGGVSVTNGKLSARLPDPEEPVDPNTGEYDDFTTQFYAAVSPPGQTSMAYWQDVACWDENGEVEYC